VTRGREEPPRPVLRVVRGNPTPEEIAALVAALTARVDAARRRAPAGGPPSAWADRARGLRTTLPRGPDAWRASGLPRP